MQKAIQIKNWIEVALQHEGYPSVLYNSPEVGNSPEGFDCSGFVQYVLQESGIPIPNIPGTDNPIRHSEEFFDWFGIFIHEDLRQRGDLVFITRNGLRPKHLGFYSGDNQVIHAPGLNNSIVEVSSLDDFCKRPIRFNSNYGTRQIYDRNPIGFKRPSIHTRGQRFQNVLSL